MTTSFVILTVKFSRGGVFVVPGGLCFPSSIFIRPGREKSIFEETLWLYTKLLSVTRYARRTDGRKEGRLDGRQGRSVSLTLVGEHDCAASLPSTICMEEKQRSKAHDLTRPSFISRLLVRDPVSPVIATRLDAIPKK